MKNCIFIAAILNFDFRQERFFAIVVPAIF